MTQRLFQIPSGLGYRAGLLFTSDLEADSCFDLSARQEDGSISLTGKGLEISGGINLSEMFNDSQALSSSIWVCAAASTATGHLH